MEHAKRKRARADLRRPRESESSALSPRQAWFERLAQMEQRLAKLEASLARLRPAPARVEREPEVEAKGPRCPGCKLAVTSTRRGRCPWCGLIFEAAADLKKAKKKAG